LNLGFEVEIRLSSQLQPSVDLQRQGSVTGNSNLRPGELDLSLGAVPIDTGSARQIQRTNGFRIKPFSIELQLLHSCRKRSLPATKIFIRVESQLDKESSVGDRKWQLIAWVERFAHARYLGVHPQPHRPIAQQPSVQGRSRALPEMQCSLRLPIARRPLDGELAGQSIEGAQNPLQPRAIGSQMNLIDSQAYIQRDVSPSQIRLAKLCPPALGKMGQGISRPVDFYVYFVQRYRGRLKSPDQQREIGRSDCC